MEITREQLEARIACKGVCRLCVVDMGVVCGLDDGTTRQMLTLMDDNQRLTERNTALEAVADEARVFISRCDEDEASVCLDRDGAPESCDDCWSHQINVAYDALDAL